MVTVLELLFWVGVAHHTRKRIASFKNQQQINE